MEEKIKRLKNAVIAIVILAVLVGTVASRFPHVEDMRDKIQFFEYTPKESSGDPKAKRLLVIRLKIQKNRLN